MIGISPAGIDLPASAPVRRLVAFLSLVVLASGTVMLAAACEPDVSCAETATCPPSESAPDANSDGGGPDGAGDQGSSADGSRASSDTGRDADRDEARIDAASDAPLQDAFEAGRLDAEVDARIFDAPTVDVSIDNADDGPSTNKDAGVLDGLVADRDAAADAVDDTAADAGRDATWDTMGDAPGDASSEGDGPIVVGDDIWAVGDSGVVLRWTKSAGWAFEMTPANGARIYDIWGTDRSNVWAVGNGDILHYDGMTWSSMPNPIPQSGLRAIWGSSRTDVWAVGYDNANSRAVVIRYNGTSWGDQAGAPTAFQGETFVAIWGSGPRDVWVIGSSKIFHFDATATWTEVITPDSGIGSAEAVWTSSPTSGWILGELGKIWQLSAGGLSPIAPYPTTPEFKAVSGLSANQVWAIGWTDLSTTTRFYRNTGAGWVDGPLVDLPLMQDIFIRSPQDVWFVGWSGVIAHYDGMTITPDPTVPTQAILYGVWGPR